MIPAVKMLQTSRFKHLPKTLGNVKIQVLKGQFDSFPRYQIQNWLEPHM